MSELTETRRLTSPPARQDARAENEEDPTSLLFIGSDSIVLVLRYLDPVSVGRCEQTGTLLRQTADPYWTALDGQVGTENKSRAGTARWRAIRYFLASRLARTIEPIISSDILAEGQIPRRSIIGLIPILPHDDYEYSFPSVPNDYLNVSDARLSNYMDELFVRIAKRQTSPEEGPTVLAERFTGFTTQADPARATIIEGLTGLTRSTRGNTSRATIIIDILGLDLGRWSELSQLKSEFGMTSYRDVENRIIEMMKGVDITVVAVRDGETAEASLVTAAGLLRDGSPVNIWSNTLGLTPSIPSWGSQVDLKNINANPSAPGTKLPKTMLGYGSLHGKFVVTVHAAYVRPPHSLRWTENVCHVEQLRS